MDKLAWLKIGFIHLIEQLFWQLVTHFKHFQWLSVCYGQQTGYLSLINIPQKIEMKG